MTDQTPIETTTAQTQFVKPGDMALILHADGNISTLAFDVDTSGISKDPEDMSEADLQVFEQGQKMFALAMAANSPMLPLR